MLQAPPADEAGPVTRHKQALLVEILQNSPVAVAPTREADGCIVDVHAEWTRLTCKARDLAIGTPRWPWASGAMAPTAPPGCATHILVDRLDMTARTHAQETLRHALRTPRLAILGFGQWLQADSASLRQVLLNVGANRTVAVMAMPPGS